ncbi:hypothetical protein EVAR_47754_1 [Eumeta japonica]|uniref:Uncharacterized protein n=1 Tax=Eumeta variegata TaxID=151549 RepID=A0A4C1VW76_EUMVA|nr:hypothetical protein EVAR_47754_1 [Eumeta japonica]
MRPEANGKTAIYSKRSLALPKIVVNFSKIKSVHVVVVSGSQLSQLINIMFLVIRGLNYSSLTPVHDLFYVRLRSSELWPFTLAQLGLGAVGDHHLCDYNVRDRWLNVLYEERANDLI